MSAHEWVPYADEEVEYALQTSLQVAWGSTEYIEMRAVPVDDYEGPYSAVPSWSNQTFDTANRYMTDDFTVSAINYTEAPNDSGITVTIGG